MFGLLNVNKPPGVTSRWVVDHVQSLTRPHKVGHAGTLDPLATGVLVLCLGPATRLTPYIQQMPKRYYGTFLLGRRSPTEDIDGEVTEVEDAPVPTIDQLRAAAADLVGTIQQRPPAFSALKIKGRRAYQLARQGKQPDLAPRQVTVHELVVVDYDYPRLTLDIRCSSGTYVRSLGRDLALALGSSAVMSELTRTAVGGFLLEQACSPQELTLKNLATHLLPPGRAVSGLPRITLTPGEAQHIVNGRRINRTMEAPSPTGEVAAFGTDGHLLAILRQRDNLDLAPVRVFATARSTLPRIVAADD